MDQTRKSRLFQSLKAVRRRKGKISALFLLGIFALVLVGSMSAPSGNAVVYSSIQPRPVKLFQEAADISEYKFVDGLSTAEVIWATTGASPYLDAQDQPTNTIDTTSNGAVSSWYTFAATSGTGTGFVVNMSAYHASTTDSFPDWELDWTNDGNADASGSFTTNGASYQWENTGTVSGLDTATEINDCRVRFIHDKGGGGPNNVEIDAARLGIYQADSGTAYEKDLTETVSAVDVQTNSVDYDRTYTEAVSSVDVITTAADMVRNLVESVGVVGVLTTLRGREKDLVESITVADVRTFSIDYARNLVETISCSDVWSKTFGLNRSEAIGVVDSGEFSKFISKNMTETIGVVDSMVRSVDYSRDMTENITVVDTRTFSIDFARALVESINVVDIIDAQKIGGIDYEKDLTEGISVSVDLTTDPPAVAIGSVFYQLFFSLDMWGILGPSGLVIGGYFASRKDVNLGIIWFMVECLVVAQYLMLVTATPNYWWHVFIVLLGGLLTCVFPLWGKK